METTVRKLYQRIEGLKKDLEAAYTEVGRHFCGIGTDSHSFRTARENARRIERAIADDRTAIKQLESLEA